LFLAGAAEPALDLVSGGRARPSPSESAWGATQGAIGGQKLTNGVGARRGRGGRSYSDAITGYPGPGDLIPR